MPVKRKQSGRPKRTTRRKTRRKDAAFARGQGTLTHAYIDKARNAELWDIEGNLIAMLEGHTAHLSSASQTQLTSAQPSLAHLCC